MMIQRLTPSPVSAWLQDFEVVQLPSGKRVGMLPVDALSFTDEKGQIPQFLRVRLERKDKNLTGDKDTTSAEDTIDTLKLAERVIRAGMVEPRIVDTAEEERAGMGIQMLRLTYMDKIALLVWSMGGKAAMDAAQRFPEPEKADVQLVAE